MTSFVKKMVAQTNNTKTGKKRRGYVEVDLSRVARLQKIAFWIVYWKISDIATVVGGAAEANRRAYNTRRRANRFHLSSVWIWLGCRFEWDPWLLYRLLYAT